MLMISWRDIPQWAISKVELIPNVLGLQSPLLALVR
jgi:hypothetical protein